MDGARIVGLFIAVIVTIGWAVNIVVGFFRPELRNPDLNTALGLVVGIVMLALRRSKKGSAEESEEDEPSSIDQVRERVASAINPDKNGEA